MSRSATVSRVSVASSGATRVWGYTVVFESPEALDAWLQEKGITPENYDLVLQALSLSPEQADAELQAGTLTAPRIMEAFSEL